ncbi:hypothetical protein Hdeb2414_s0070g00772871 [Helianthus debilis subsp. tardiflorus]
MSGNIINKGGIITKQYSSLGSPKSCKMLSNFFLFAHRFGALFMPPKSELCLGSVVTVLGILGLISFGD